MIWVEVPFAAERGGHRVVDMQVAAAPAAHFEAVLRQAALRQAAFWLRGELGVREVLLARFRNLDTRNSGRRESGQARNVDRIGIALPIPYVDSPRPDSRDRPRRLTKIRVDLRLGHFG